MLSRKGVSTRLFALLMTVLPNLESLTINDSHTHGGSDPMYKISESLGSMSNTSSDPLASVHTSILSKVTEVRLIHIPGAYNDLFNLEHLMGLFAELPSIWRLYFKGFNINSYDSAEGVLQQSTLRATELCFYLCLIGLQPFTIYLTYF